MFLRYNIISVLDLGRGLGIYSIGLALANEKLDITVFDHGYCKQYIDQNSQNFGISERVHFIEGDYRKDNFKGNYDLIILSDILRGHGKEEILFLLGKIYCSLNNNGKIVIKEAISNHANELNSIIAAVHSLNMISCSREGKLYKYEELNEMLAQCHFKNIELTSIDEVSSLITAFK